MSRPQGRSAWWSAVAALAVSAPVHAAGFVVSARALLALSAALLALHAVARVRALHRKAGGWRWTRDVVLACLTLPALAALPAAAGLVPLAPEWRLVLGGLAAELFLAALGLEPDRRDAARGSRRILPFAGHAAALSGTYLVLVHRAEALHVATLAFASALAVLALHAFWTRRLACERAGEPADDGWEPLLLVAILALVLGVTVRYVALVGWVPGWLAPPAVGLALPGAIVTTFAIASPPAAPKRLRAVADGMGAMLAHGAAGLAILNVLFVLFAIVATWSARLVIILLTAYLALAVAMEYRSVRRAARTRDALFSEPPAPPVSERFTVVVAALNDAETLVHSLRHNVEALPSNAHFLVVASSASTDDTVAVAHRFAQQHPERVRVLEGAAATKAGDLNDAWSMVDTEVILLLDADERVDAESVARAFARLRQDERTAVVQGRKVSQDPYGSGLNRFINTERRHSTGLDQPMHDDLGSAHFAGSSALMRRQAVIDAGGWTSETLTEDIEFTLRLHLRTGWRIVYEPRFVVREADPVDLSALVRQRTRWARGWTQCFARYFAEIPERRRHLGPRRTFGLIYLMAMAVSAPLMALFPAMVLLRALGVPSLLPFAIAVTVAAFILPARLVGYGYSALHDPHIPVPRRPGALLEHIVHAYAWIMFGWLVHFHALYLELSSAPHVWYVTRKNASEAIVPLPMRKRPGAAP